MLVKHYPELFAGEPDLAERAERFAEKSHELVSFLVDVLGVEKVAARYDGTVAYHDSCAGLRELGVKTQPRRLLAGVEGLTLVELEEAETCCGFGGLFAAKYGELSNAIVSRKSRRHSKIRGRHRARGRSRLPHEHGRQAPARGLGRSRRAMSPRFSPAWRTGRRSAKARRKGAPMSEVATSAKFKENAHEALTDARLQGALVHSRNFVVRRAAAVARLPEFDALRDSARAIKDHTLAHLDLYLEAYERKVRESGGDVHYAQDAEEARRIIIDLCKSMGAKSVTKGKSMISEEIGLNHALEAAGIEAVETDLGEYIIQLRGETPSHIIAPAIHLTARDVEQEFRKAHRDLPPDRGLAEPEQLLAEARRRAARQVPRRRRRHYRRELPDRRDRNVDHRHQRGQRRPDANPAPGAHRHRLDREDRADAGGRRAAPARAGALGDRAGRFGLHDALDRPAPAAAIPTGRGAYHVVLLDNGRSAMLGGEFEDMLRCIRCGACMNHCPVYQAVGGHAYGWVYPGPMGAVLTPSLIGVAEGGQLPNASTFCGRCEEVCPVRIPLPNMMRHWREREFERRLSPAPLRYGLASGRSSPAVRRSTASPPISPRARCTSPGAARAASPGCRSPAAGPAIATSPRPRATTFQSQWRARSGAVR